MNNNFKTDQEEFWCGEFGDEYIERNSSAELLAANLHFFSYVTNNMPKINSVLEIGCNVGMNIRALNLLMPNTNVTGIEINKKAADIAKSISSKNTIINDSVINLDVRKQYDLVFTKGVLIHINPDELNDLYIKMGELSTKYVLIAEYFNPSPVSIDYRGHKDRLFKRDFADDFIKKNSDFRLLDYKFHYKKSENYSQDDITWFLLERS